MGRVTAASVRARLSRAGLRSVRKAKGRKAYEGYYTARDSVGLDGAAVEVSTRGQVAHDLTKAALVEAGYRVAVDERPDRPWRESMGRIVVVAES